VGEPQRFTGLPCVRPVTDHLGRVAGPRGDSPNVLSDIEIVNVEVRAIAPGVVAAVILLKVGPFTPPDGVPRPASDDRLSLILVNRDGQWRIAHGHNTVIDPVAQPFDPVKSGWPQQDAKSGKPARNEGT